MANFTIAPGNSGFRPFNGNEYIGVKASEELNDVVQGLASNFRGTSEPTTEILEPGMFWLDTSLSPPVLKMRNSANTGWLPVSFVDDDTVMPTYGVGGYEFTGGFTDRTTGTAGASDVGSNVQYTTAMRDAGTFMRFGFDSTSQNANDNAYWTDPTPSPTAGIGLFGGLHMPAGVTSMFDFDFDEPAGYSAAVTTGDLQYTAATGSYDFSQLRPGDQAIIRFDFNVLPQVGNTTVEVGLIWQTRDSDGNPTFTFNLAGPSAYFSESSVGKTILQRPTMTAYFASEEDVQARALPAIRSDNLIQIQPLTTLFTIVR